MILGPQQDIEVMMKSLSRLKIFKVVKRRKNPQNLFKFLVCKKADEAFLLILLLLLLPILLMPLDLFS